MNDVSEIFPAYADYLQPARFKVAYGGRGSAKTRTFITILTNNVLYYGWRVVCFRELMESISDSVYQEFVEEIDRRELHGEFIVLKTEILCPRSGGVIKFSGIKASANRLNSQKLKGFAHFDAAWLEEANPVSKESWNALIPTMRKSGSEIWVSFNPENPLEETYVRFVTGRIYPDEKDGRRYCIVKKINYTDNPRFPRELQDDAELMRENDPQLFRHVYLGEPVANHDLAIIKPEWMEAVFDADLKLANFPRDGGRFGGFDVSDEGPDPNALVGRHGVTVTHIEEWRDKDPNSAARHAYAWAEEERLDLLQFDDIGVGAGAKGEFRRLEEAALAENHKTHRLTVEGFTASDGVVAPDAEYRPGKRNRDMFLNLKAQAWWGFADRCRNTYNAVRGQPYDPEQLVSIGSHLPLAAKLGAELCQPRREYSNGKVKVESKESLKKRGIPSHNLADAAIMAFAPDDTFDLAALL